MLLLSKEQQTCFVSYPKTYPPKPIPPILFVFFYSPPDLLGQTDNGRLGAGGHRRLLHETIGHGIAQGIAMDDVAERPAAGAG